MSALGVSASNDAPRGVGIGLRARHYREFLDSRPGIDWVEVHSENYFGEGGYDLHVLEQVRARHPISLHGVALSLGSADGLRERHVAKLKRLVNRIEPALVSEHLCWGSFGSRHFNDLLPLPYTVEALDQIVAHITQVQESLQRRILVENVSSYLQFRVSEIPEFDFLAEVAKRSGCGILLDVNNLYVNSVNHGFDPVDALHGIPAHAVGEIHLAGHSAAEDLLIDDHGSRVAPEVWDLYAVARGCLGPVPTLVEWDTRLPPLDVLLDEAAMAARIHEREYV
jgi:uncharacterized protein (UPF0276 family)